MSDLKLWPPHVTQSEATAVEVVLDEENDIRYEVTLRELVMDAIERHGFRDAQEKAGLLAMADELRALADEIVAPNAEVTGGPLAARPVD